MSNTDVQKIDTLMSDPKWKDFVKQQAIIDLRDHDLFRNQYQQDWVIGNDTAFRSGSGRQTGRTSEMLWQAACAKDEGHRVMVVVHEQRMAHYCLKLLLGGWWGLDERDFVTIKDAWQHLRGRGPEMVVLMDHFVVELAHESRLIAKCLHELEYEMRHHNMKFAAIPQPTITSNGIRATAI